MREATRGATRGATREAAREAARGAARGPALQALYAELAQRDRELARLRASLGGLRQYALGGDPSAGNERRPFDLMAAVQAALCATQSELRGAIVSVRIQPLVVFGSLAGITQVLVHLLVNAANAMQASGRPPVVHIDAARSGQRVRVRVSDNGHGLAPAVMQRLFEPFFTTAGKGLGLGLGLTISSAIVRTHGGVLACSNRAPHGARFFFDLPSAGHSGAIDTTQAKQTPLPVPPAGHHHLLEPPK